MLCLGAKTNPEVIISDSESKTSSLQNSSSPHQIVYIETISDSTFLIMVSQTTTQQPTEPHSLSVTAAAREAFVPTMRELVRAYQAFNSYADSHVRQLGLTPSQFDVIATLGGTNGMSMGEVAEKTLVTKGTLTGIIDRLEQKELVRREVPAGNRRSFTVVLTPAGGIGLPGSFSGAHRLSEATV